MLALALLPDALANGQTSHQWITLMAIDELPPGDLADFVARPDVRDALLNGTMFPDGGYAVGDDYGEMAHWEPTQDLFLDWIVATYGPSPEEGDGAEDTAFLLGMMSHGMADQFYDSTYLERSKQYDPPESYQCCSVDEAADVAYAAGKGQGTVPPKWWPEELLGFFAENGHEVDYDTVDQGQSLLGIAIAYVGAASEVDETVDRYTAEFPWACSHQLDPDALGNPAHEARTVAAYWQVVWDRLHGGDGWSAPVIATIPDDGGWQAVRDHALVEGRIAVVFARGLDPSTVVDGSITVATADGEDVPVSLDVYYGYASHVVNVTPLEDWGADTDYVVTVHPGVTTFGGLEVEEPITWTFTTREPVTDTGGDTAEDISAPDDPGCGCGGGGSAAGLLLVGTLAAGQARRKSR